LKTLILSYLTFEMIVFVHLNAISFLSTDLLVLTGISKIFKSRFLLHYQKYNVLHALTFFKNF